MIATTSPIAISAETGIALIFFSGIILAVIMMFFYIFWPTKSRDYL